MDTLLLPQWLTAPGEVTQSSSHPLLWAMAPSLSPEQADQLREHLLRQLHHAGEEVR